jgi:hypothetical protein
MTLSALPEHLDEADEWKGTDWDNPWQRWLLKYKHWLAFGPRAKEWWARWREYPILLFAFVGPGYARWENTDGSFDACEPKRFYFFVRDRRFMPAGVATGEPAKDEELKIRCYFSVIQYWAKYHVALQWPLHLSFHYDQNEPPPPKGRPVDDHKMWFFRFGCRRDGDKVYWLFAWFLGRTFN